MKNYRITFGEDIHFDYWKHFDACEKTFYITIQNVFDFLKANGVEYMWFFYETYVEINFMHPNYDFEATKEIFLKMIPFEDVEFLESGKGEELTFADWYCDNEREKEFGAKRHDLCRQWVELYHEYKDDVDAGKGRVPQLARTIHTLANPLALNYWQEGKMCFFYGFQCLLLRRLSPKRVGWIMGKIFRHKKKESKVENQI